MVNIGDIIFYLGIFALSTSLVFVGEKYRSRVAIAMGLILPILCAAFRLHVGIDYDNYIRLFGELENLSFKEFSNSYLSTVNESSLYFIVQFAKTFPFWQIVFFGTYSVITLVPFYLAIRKISKKYTWLAMLFYLLMFFAPSLNIMRQFAAISVVFWATINYLYSNKATLAKIFYFTLAIMIATLLHSSAILALVILPFIWLAKSLAGRPAGRVVFYSILTMALAVVAEFMIIRHIHQIPLLNRYAHYLTWSMAGMPIPNLIPRLAPVLIGMWALTKKDLRSKNLMCYYILICLSLVLTFLGFLIPYGYRVSDYFMIFQIPLFIEIVAQAKRKNQARIYLMIIVAYALIYFFYSSVLNNSHGIFPYQLLFA